jgi:hypothetical protein
MILAPSYAGADIGGLHGGECGKNDVPEGVEACGTASWDGVIPCVPIKAQRPIIEIDDIDCRNADLDERDMVVLNGLCAVRQISAVTQPMSD